MTEKVKIGEHEYMPPFRELDDEEINEVWVMDAGNNYVKVESVIAALNELAHLRQENAGLKKFAEYHKSSWLAFKARLDATPDEEGKA